MTENQKTLIEILSEYLKKNPNLRFSQALFNLNINQFADPINPETKGFLLKDIYNDTDEQLLERIFDNLPDTPDTEEK